MDNQTTIRWLPTYQGSSLRRIITELIQNVKIKGANHENEIINEIPSNILLQTNVKKVTILISKITSVLNYITEKSRIHITAKSYSNLVLVHFRETNLQVSNFLSDRLDQLNSEARQLGGVIGITNSNKKITTIAFTFTNVKSLPNYFFEKITGQRLRMLVGK